VLPEAAHPRQVVLELRELDLELALGGDGVLGEDVEDQLRAVDDARAERVLEEALLNFSSSSFPLPAYVRRAGRGRCCTTRPTGSTPAVLASSSISASSSSASAPWARTARTNPRSGSGERGIIEGDYAR
jgi:hypothetical protein